MKMEKLMVCPSTLAEGFDTYSPAARTSRSLTEAMANTVSPQLTTSSTPTFIYITTAVSHWTRVCFAKECS